MVLTTPQKQVIAEYEIPPRSAIAYQVKAGQYIQIIDPEGSQCSDFLAFAGDNYEEELDNAVTRTINTVATAQVGLYGKYFSQKMRPLVEVIQDTSGCHDSFLLACTSKYYEDAGYPGHPSCSENFNRALAEYGIKPRLGWAAINFFFNTHVDEMGNIVTEESRSRPGDYVILQAKTDLLCASSACPDDIDPANGWHPTSIQVRIYDSETPFNRALGIRATPDAPVRLTRDSAFTPRIRTLTDDLVEYNGFWVANSFANRGEYEEYWCLREKAVLIDLSALRKWDILGKDALELLQITFSRNLEKLAVGQATYGCLINGHGGILDDGIVFRLNEKDYRYVGNCDRDQEWLEKIANRLQLDVKIIPKSDQLHNLSLQGARSRDILRPLLTLDGMTLDELGYFRFATGRLNSIPVFVSRTGYTGELGYEIFVHPDEGVTLWDTLMEAGASYGLSPMGMLALDRARIEAGLLSAGCEFDDLTSPYQAGIGWCVSLKKPHLIGKTALEKIKPYPPRVAVGLVLASNDIACGGQCIYAQGERWRVGQVTSGTYSPILKRSIALAQVVPEFAQPETVLEVGFRDGIRRVSAVVGSLAAFDPQKTRVKS